MGAKHSQEVIITKDSCAGLTIWSLQTTQKLLSKKGSQQNIKLSRDFYAGSVFWSLTTTLCPLDWNKNKRIVFVFVAELDVCRDS